MITRKSFFIRWLLVSDEEEQKDENSVIDIEHIQSGDKCRLSNLEEASYHKNLISGYCSRERIQNNCQNFQKTSKNRLF